MEELLLQHNKRLENCPFRVPFYIHAKAPREKLLQNNQNMDHNQRTLMKYIYMSKNRVPPQDKMSRPHPNVNSVCFDDPYDYIHHIENTHEDTHLIDTQEQYMENNEVEQDEI